MAYPEGTARRLRPVLERALVGRGSRGARAAGEVELAGQRGGAGVDRRGAEGRQQDAGGELGEERVAAAGVRVVERHRPAVVGRAREDRVDRARRAGRLQRRAAAERGDVPQRAVAHDRRGRAGRVTGAVGQRAVDLADRARPGDAVGDLDALGGPAHDQHAVGGTAHRDVAQRRPGRQLQRGHVEHRPVAAHARERDRDVEDHVALAVVAAGGERQRVARLRQLPRGEQRARRRRRALLRRLRGIRRRVQRLRARLAGAHQRQRERGHRHP